MALTEEQQIMEKKVIHAGYQLKFDVQLHRLKRGLIEKNIYLEKRKITVSDNKLSMKRDFVDNFTDDMRQFLEDDEEGNPVEKMLTDSEVDALAEDNWQIEINQFDSSIAHNIENMALLDAEIGFRNDGLVEREPTGTTHFVDPMQNGDGSTFDNAWRYLHSFTNLARDAGDVCIVRRVRGGFNPSDEIFINKYSRYQFNNAVGDDDITDIGNFDNVRDVGFQPSAGGVIGKGTIKAWNQDNDDYGHDSSGTNRSGIAVTHAQKTMIGDSHERVGNTAQSLYQTPAPTPRGIYMDNCTPTSDNYQNTFHDTSRWKDLWTTTNPRDKSRLVHLQHKTWDIQSPDDVTNRIQPNSSGDMNNPIVVTADFENLWQDFLDTGNDDESGSPGWGHDGDNTQYTVEVGSKILRRKKANNDPVEVHSYITPGDWIFVGRLTNDPLRKVDSTYSDDPYEFSYQVRDVNYDKIVLWLPYKGEQAGSDKRLVSMGYAPRVYSNNYLNDSHNADESHNGSKMYSDADTNWLWQGIEWFDSWSEHTSTYYEVRNIQLYFNGRCQHKFKDCSFFGQSHGDGHMWYPSSTNWNKRHTTAIIRTNYDSNDIEYEKCVFGNTRYVVYDYYNCDSYHYQSSMKFNDCLMNGSIMDNQFSNTCVPNDHYSWIYGFTTRTSHRYPMSVLYSRRNDYYEFNDCEMVNWKYQIFKVMPQTELKCRGVKFLGTGMDFVDPMATNDADAQENLGLRYSRALFAGDPGIHPITQGSSKANNHLGTGDATGGWTYDMIYPNADAHASNSPNTGNKVIETSSASELFGRFRNNAWANMGSKWFVYTPSDLTIGTNTNGATSTGGMSVGSGTETRLDSARAYRDGEVWRNQAEANSGGAYGFSTQPTNATGNLEPIASANNETQTYGSDPQGYNDNQMSQPYNGHWDGSSNMSDWENMLAFNGALAIMGAKGFDDKGALVWDWDQYWRSGNADVHGNSGSGSGGSWALRTSDGTVRYPHVYGGVRIPPSISELLGRFFCWYPFFRATPWSNEGCYKNNWPSYHSNNDSGSDTNERTSNNTTLAPKWTGADNRSNDGAIWDTNYTNSNNSYDWQLSNGCGFGIGSAPMHGIVTIYDHQNGQDKNRPINQNFKKTSQDHYQLFLNYDYNQYKDKGYFTSDYEQFQDKPLLTGVEGIGKGIIWQQGRMDHWDITPSLTGMGASKTVGYRVDSTSGDPQFRGTAYQWMTPVMETVVDNDLIQSGGGNYLIKVYPPWMLGKGMEPPNPFAPGLPTTDISNNYQRQWREQNSLKIFEYPFYLSQNSRTYTVNIRPDPGTSTEFSWLSNPTGSDMYLEMEFFDTDFTTDRLQQSRKLKRSNSSVDMGTNAWSQLSVTVTPKSEGVGYLRLWYAKPKETGKVNVFYVDPKVVVY